MLKRWRNLRHQVRVTIISTGAATLVLGVVLYMTGFLLAKSSLDVARRYITNNAPPSTRREKLTLAEAIVRVHRNRERGIEMLQGGPPPAAADAKDRTGAKKDTAVSSVHRAGSGFAPAMSPLSSSAKGPSVKTVTTAAEVANSDAASSTAGAPRDMAAPQRREQLPVASALYTADGKLIPDSWWGRETPADGNWATPPDGKWTQTYLNGNEIKWPENLSSIKFPDQILVAPPVRSASAEYQRLAIFDASDRYADIHRTNVALLALFPFLVAVLGLVSYMAVGTSFKPLKKLLAQANELGFDDRLTTADKAEFGQLASSINQYLDRIQAVVKQQEEFAVDAAHELCTPLTALRGELELAMMQRRDSAGYEEAAKNAVAQVTRLQRLVEGLLLATRPREASITKCDVEQMLEEVQARWVDRYAAHHVNLELAAEAFKASMPEEELESVLENLLSNALKFSPSGSTVRIALDKNGHLIVEDQGPGIPEGDRDRIFERFERGTTKARGFGVGLYLVRRLLEQRGGSVKIGESQIGTRIEVALPA